MIVLNLMLLLAMGPSDETTKMKMQPAPDTWVGIIRSAWTADGTLGSVTFSTLDGDQEEVFTIDLDEMGKSLASKTSSGPIAIVGVSFGEGSARRMTVSQHGQVYEGMIDVRVEEGKDPRVMLATPSGVTPSKSYRIAADDKGKQLVALSTQRVQIMGATREAEGENWLQVDRFWLVTRGTLRYDEKEAKIMLSKPLPSGEKELDLLVSKHCRKTARKLDGKSVELTAGITFAGDRKVLTSTRILRVFEGMLEVDISPENEVLAATLMKNGDREPLHIVMDKRGMALTRAARGKRVTATGMVQQLDGARWLTVQSYDLAR